jgi:hypothetical protein
MDEQLLRGTILGLLLGAGVGGHALRIVTLDLTDPRSKSRKYIAVGAMVLYAIAAVQVFFHYTSGSFLTIFGPVVGVTAVIGSGTKVDLFQLVLGVFQILAAVAAIALLVNG